jgi:proteasome accessory factor C
MAGGNRAMTRVSASDRYARLLSIVPWIAAHDGPRIDEVCERFSLTRAELLLDLEVVYMVGVYPYTPDEMIDVVIDEDTVRIDYPDFFRRPLRLTPEQALALLAASSTLLAIPGADHAGPLARGLSKVANVLDIEAEEAMEIDLGDVPLDRLQLLRDATRDHHVVKIDYYAYGRDEQTERDIEPHRVYVDQGNWYLAAFCRRAQDSRVFRIDRMASAIDLGEPFEAPSEVVGASSFTADSDDPIVTIDVGPDGQWMIEHYPVIEVEELDDGWARVSLAVSATPWLERLLLRLGRDVRPVDGPADLLACGRGAAQRVLERYRSVPRME